MPLLSLTKRYYCVDDFAGGRECYEGDDGFWYTDVCLLFTSCSRDIKLTTQQKGIIVKWIILASFFVIFFGWFVGGRIHAKQRLRKGLPLLGYHRVRLALFPPQCRRRHQILTRSATVSDILLGTSPPWPSPPEPLHLLPNTKPLRPQPTVHTEAGRHMGGTPAVVPEHRCATTIFCATAARCHQGEP